MFKNPCEKDKRVESVIIHKMKELDRNTIFEIKNSVEQVKENALRSFFHVA